MRDVVAMTALTLTEAAPQLHRDDIAAENYTRDLMARCEREQELNAFISIDRTLLSLAARRADEKRRAGQLLGPLHSVPIALKDNINTTGLQTTAGSAGLVEFRAQSDAPVARWLFEAGALLLGKSSMLVPSIGPRFR